MNPKTFSIILVALFSMLSLNAQSDTQLFTKENIEPIILEHDKQFWESYNHCNIQKFKTFFIEDFEFYHDKEGLTVGLSKLMKTVEDGLCKKGNPKVRREVVKGTVHVYPLNTYGAIISGEHVFYVTEKGEEEKLSQIAKFTHVWQYKNGNWKMTRALSYDHQSPL